MEGAQGQSRYRWDSLGLVVLTRYREGKQWRPRENSRAQAMMALFERTLVAHTRPEFALDVLQKAVAEARVLKGLRGEASEAARAVLDHVSGFAV